MDERETLTISLFDHDSYSGGGEVEMPLAEAVRWLQGLLDKVPEESRDRAFFHVSLDYGVYDDPTRLDFQVFYNREETEEEAAARVADAKRRKEESKRYEIARLRANLERLESEAEK